jgi:cysteinyl-tRNA synthetase
VSLRIFDSFVRRKLDFEPVVPGQVGMYLCGPTVQNSPHIGHARTAISFDMVRRSLMWLGFKVRFVRNVTDIDDKIIVRAREHGEDTAAFASRYADEYNRAMQLVHVLPPDVEPRVTGHIKEIVAIIETLVSRGHAYPAAGDVYYAVDSFADYGKLSGQAIDDLQAGARVEPGEQKRSPLDFALWKAAKPGEPSWPSPWGEGRPGWHIECSAMALTHLGEKFDLHGGGKDLVFPHHENEIAQSQGACGPGTFSRYWLHAGFLNLKDPDTGEERKMSKSLGNVLGVPEMTARHSGEALRFFYFCTHYRSPLNFDIVGGDTAVHFPGLEEAERRLDYFYSTLVRLDDFLGDAKVEAGALLPEAEALRGKVVAAMEDDFNSALCLAELGEAVKLANKLLDEPKGVAKDVRKRSLARLRHDVFDIGHHVLGFFNQAPRDYLAGRRDALCKKKGIDQAWVGEQLAAREAARKGKDFAAADGIRGALRERGVEVMDTPRGADWRVVDQ